jgi:thymidine kinase
MSEQNSVVEERAAAPSRLTLIVGPMFAGKTVELYRRFCLAKSIGATCALIKNSCDTRMEGKCILTHDVTHEPISATHVVDRIEELSNLAVDEVFIDEGQFFADIANVCALFRASTKITVAMLNGDYECHLFANTANLYPHADEIILLKSVCRYCSKKTGIYSERLLSQPGQILIGGDDIYAPVCSSCKMRHTPHLIVGS